MFGTLAGLAFISRRLARIYIEAAIATANIFCILNDWLYAGPHWTLRTLLKIDSGWLLALLSFVAEVALLWTVLLLARHFLSVI